MEKANIQKQYNEFAPKYDFLPMVFCSEVLGVHRLRKNLIQHAKGNVLEIAAGTGLALSTVHATLISLSERGEISSCNVTKFIDGQPVEGLLCRIAGTIPPAAPGRKASVKPLA